MKFISIPFKHKHELFIFNEKARTKINIVLHFKIYAFLTFIKVQDISSHYLL